MHNPDKRSCSPNSGQAVAEYALILVLVAAATILILAVIGVDIGGIFGRINQAIGIAEEDLPPGIIEVTVLDNNGLGVADTYVYAFDAQGNWTGLYAYTNSEGVAFFEDVADGDYQFMVYQSPHFYRSKTITYPEQDRATITIEVRKFTVTVRNGDGKGLEHVYVYGYTANEQIYLDIYGRTDDDGRVSFDLPNGDYKFQAYSKGHYYWSPAVNSPDQDSTVIEVADHTVTVTVVDAAGQGVKESQLYVYAYTEDGSYAGEYGRTNGNGRAKLELPSGTYQFRVYYQASDYWSDTISVPATDEVVIKTEQRPYTVSVVDDRGRSVKNVWVYVFSGNTVYFGLYGKTNNQGEVEFDLPRGEFQFRADYHSHAYWSDVISTTAGSSTTITLR